MYALQYNDTNTIQYNTVQYNTAQYNAIHYNIMIQYNVMLYNTLHYTTYYGMKPITENMLGGVCWWFFFFVCSEMFSNKSTIFVIEESRK